MEKEFRVNFLPDRKHVYVIKGSPVFEAAGRAGILLAAPCGGEGKCGKCRVKVIKGRLSEPSLKEKSALKPGEMSEGFRLSCQALILGDCSLEVPASSMVGAMSILVSGRLKSVKLEPGLEKKFVQLPERRAGSHLSYSGMIRERTGCRASSPPLLRKIPGLVLENNEGITAVCRGGTVAGIEKGDTTSRCFGVALDLGTTTLAASLLDLRTGKELALSSSLNPQFKFGDDLINRIHYANKSKKHLQTISGASVSAVNGLIGKLSGAAGILTSDIYKLTVAGNTVMQHLFCGINPASMGEIPFIPAVSDPVRLSAREAGINISPAGEIYVFPVIGGFVGGDSVAATLASGMASSKKKRILIDIGTNGEIIAGNSEKLISASAAAGPAFESARISMGMIASPGAIEKVIINEDVHVNVIGNQHPAGICGSGLLDAAAQMLEAGIISSSGRLLKAEELPGSVPAALSARLSVRNGETVFRLSGENNHKDVFITQRDIRELQLAKSAIYSGMRILKRKLAMKLEDIEEVLIAGAFGNFIRRSSAKRVGLIPDIPSNRIKFIGNASSSGARLALLSESMRVEAERIADNVKNVELASSPAFHSQFAENMFFPE